MKLSEVKRDYIDEILEQGLAQTRSQAELLFAESLTRNLVSVEIMDMCRYIAENEPTKRRTNGHSQPSRL